MALGAEDVMHEQEIQSQVRRERKEIVGGICFGLRALCGDESVASSARSQAGSAGRHSQRQSRKDTFPEQPPSVRIAKPGLCC